ncbi:MAG TPA: hypothetical protein VLA13_10990 [Massilibacterium sp.]|nr:hypothetical protein [Massilibacterium sp.]
MEDQAEKLREKIKQSNKKEALSRMKYYKHKRGIMRFSIGMPLIRFLFILFILLVITVLFSEQWMSRL